tara:strand:+ start:36 stop:482 length:447 start_codon:yes stop_codon:yes gene_type:complete
MKKNKYQKKYNMRKVKNSLDRYRMFSLLSIFYRLNKTQLTTKQLHILGTLLFYSKIKKVCINDLNEQLFKQNHSSLSRVASSLEKKGLVDKEKIGQKVYLTLSKKGFDYLNRLYYSYNMQNADDTSFYTTSFEEMARVLDSYNNKKVA